MKWRAKAMIQSWLGHLPNHVSNPLYYCLQRHFGNLRRDRTDPTSRFLFGMEFCRQIVEHGRSPDGATFFEVGTGWRLNVPIACWLCGAGRIITVDLNSFLREDLVNEDLTFIRRNASAFFDRCRSEYGDLIQPDRWRRLLRIASAKTTLSELGNLLRLEYVAPADAAHTNCDSRSIDFHLSCNALEHIPEETLRSIFLEASRITRPTGLLLHRVDHTDHFSHADPLLSPIHFLRYSDSQWHRYANNRFAYVNRLREDDYLQLFRECGQEILAAQSENDAGTLELLRQGFPVDSKFRDKNADTLSRLTSLFVLTPNGFSPKARELTRVEAVASHSSAGILVN